VANLKYKIKTEKKRPNEILFIDKEFFPNLAIADKNILTHFNVVDKLIFLCTHTPLFRLVYFRYN